MSAPQAHLDKPAVLERALSCLSNLAFLEDNSVVAAASGAIELVVQAMVLHAGNEGIAERGSAVLLAVAFWERGRVRAAPKGGVDAVISGIRNIAKDMEMKDGGICGTHGGGLPDWASPDNLSSLSVALHSYLARNGYGETSNGGRPSRPASVAGTSLFGDHHALAAAAAAEAPLFDEYDASFGLILGAEGDDLMPSGVQGLNPKALSPTGSTRSGHGMGGVLGSVPGSPAGSVAGGSVPGSRAGTALGMRDAAGEQQQQQQLAVVTPAGAVVVAGQQREGLTGSSPEAGSRGGTPRRAGDGASPSGESVVGSMVGSAVGSAVGGPAPSHVGSGVGDKTGRGTGWTSPSTGVNVGTTPSFQKSKMPSTSRLPTPEGALIEAQSRPDSASSIAASIAAGLSAVGADTHLVAATGAAGAFVQGMLSFAADNNAMLQEEVMDAVHDVMSAVRENMGAGALASKLAAAAAAAKKKKNARPPPKPPAAERDGEMALEGEGEVGDGGAAGEDDADDGDGAESVAGSARSPTPSAKPQPLSQAMDLGVARVVAAVQRHAATSQEGIQFFTDEALRELFAFAVATEGDGDAESISCTNALLAGVLLQAANIVSPSGSKVLLLTGAPQDAAQRLALGPGAGGFGSRAMVAVGGSQGNAEQEQEQAAGAGGITQAIVRMMQRGIADPLTQARTRGHGTPPFLLPPHCHHTHTITLPRSAESSLHCNARWRSALHLSLIINLSLYRANRSAGATPWRTSPPWTTTARSPLMQAQWASWRRRC